LRPWTITTLLTHALSSGGYTLTDHLQPLTPTYTPHVTLPHLDLGLDPSIARAPTQHTLTLRALWGEITTKYLAATYYHMSALAEPREIRVGL
jgi:hypothetical protein